MKTNTWQLFAFKLGIFAAIQFFLLTGLAMWLYPGGTIHHPEYESYDFLYNYFSDLGRTRTFDGESNMLCHLLFKSALSISGLCLIFFFVALPSLFKSNRSKALILIASFLGILSGICYIGIAYVPYNVDYWQHRMFVRTGFILFLFMSLFYAIAILVDKNYPRRYAAAFGVFGIILFIQVVIMLFGPRAYRSNEGLYLQATAQKIVVYAEILCMLYQSLGAMRVWRVLRRFG
ncbi:MAG: hypothetical protein ACI8P3_002254 [Saprospiraceae bacterium]|jgi:hypothetical protein